MSPRTGPWPFLHHRAQSRCRRFHHVGISRPKRFARGRNRRWLGQVNRLSESGILPGEGELGRVARRQHSQALHPVTHPCRHRASRSPSSSLT